MTCNFNEQWTQTNVFFKDFDNNATIRTAKTGYYF